RLPPGDSGQGDARTSQYLARDVGAIKESRRSSPRHATLSKAHRLSRRSHPLMARRQTAQAGGRVMRSHCADRSRAPASAASARGLSPRKPKVVTDAVHPGICRVRWPDGRMSDMTNLTRAKDAITCFIETEERRQRGRHSPPEGRLCVKTDAGTTHGASS